MKRTLQLALLLLLISALQPANGQVAIGTGATAPTPNPNAVLLLVGNGTNQGLIIPSVKNSDLPSFGSAGMVVYNSTNNTVHYHNGAGWNTIGAGGSGTQGIQISGNTVSLTATPNAGFGLSSPAPTATGQLLVWNGTGWESTPAPTTNGQTLSWNQTTGKWTIGTGATVATLGGDVQGASNSTTISTTAGNNIVAAVNNAATTSKILPAIITQGLANQVLTTNAAGTSAVWANAATVSLPSLSANQLLSNNGANTGINVGGDLGLSVAGTTGTFTIANNAITTSKILDLNVTNAKLNKTGIPLSGFAAPTVAVDFGSQRITNLAAPTAATDATTKAYVDITDATKLNSTILTTSGDILYNDGTSTTRLPRGALGDVLQSTATGIQWAPGGGSGEANTASNTGIGGVGVFDQKTGVNLELRNINAATNRIGVALDAANNEIDIDVNEANLSIAASQLTGQLGIANGGTGASTLPLNSVLLGNGTGAISAVTGGSPTNVLTLNGSNIPVWQAAPGGVSAVSGSGPITVANGTSTPAISISQANASTPGFLSASDFSAFNAKQNALTFGNVTSGSTALTVGGGTGAAVGGNVTLSLNTGTAANQLVQLDGTGRLPAVDGSQLIGLPGGGDINGVDTPVGGGLIGGLSSGTPSLRLLNGSATGQILKWDNPTTSWVLGTDDVGSGSLPTLTDGQVIISVGANNPQGRVLQQDVSVDAASGNVTVRGLRGTPISATAPGANQVLKFNAGTYSPAADNDSQNLSVGGTGTVATGETFPLGITSGTGVNIIEGTNVQIDRVGSNLTINTSGGGSPTGSATGDLAGNYPAPTINTSSATTGANIITAINTATAGTINTARLNTGVVLDTESPVSGDITGTYGTGFQIAAGTIAGTDLVNNITIATTGNITGANVIGNGSGLTSLNAGNVSSGTLAVARGGTGITAITPGAVAYGGASNFAFTTAGIAGQLLQSNGAAAPTWVNAPASFTTVNTVPKGSATGLIASSIFDSGTYTGIGRTTPIGSSRFDIQASGFGANGYGGMYIQTDNTGWPFYGYSNNGGTSMWTYWNGSTGTWNVNNNGDRLSVTNSGNVGIGTTTPSAPLTISASGTDKKIVMFETANNEHQYLGFGYTGLGELKYQVGFPANDHVFLAGNGPTTSTELMRIKGSGNVGIGTLSPTERLEVNGGIFVNGASPTNLLRFAQAGFDFPTFTSRSIGTKVVLWPAMSAASTDFAIGVGLGTTWYSVPSATSSQAHRFFGGTTELMQIRGDGNVGIGTINPAHKLDVSGDSRITGSLGIGTAPSTGDDILVSRFNSTPTSFAFAGSSIALESGTASIASTKWAMESSSGGLIIFGDQSLSGRLWFSKNDAAIAVLDNTYFAPYGNGALDLGTTSFRWNRLFYTTGILGTSDKRLKKAITPIEYGLNEVMKLKPVSFLWNQFPEQGLQLGLIAQEVQDVLPEVVNVGSDTLKTLSLNHLQLLPVLIKAAQELNAKIETLEKENLALKGANTELKTAVSSLKEKQQAEIALLKKQMEEVLRIVGAEAKKD